MDSEDHAGVALTMTLVSDQKSKHKIPRIIDAFCLSHLDRFITVVSVGDQNQSIPIKAAAGNGVTIESLMAENKKDESLGQADAWLEIKLRRFGLRNCNVSVGCEENFMLSQDKGVFLVHLKGIRKNKTIVDHVVLVDAGKKIV